MALQEYKCANCGGPITFDSRIQKMKCPHCGAELDVEGLRALDEDQQNSQPDDLTWNLHRAPWQEGETDSLRVYLCRSCGGEIVGDQNLAATSCPYCGNPVVMVEQVSGVLRPDIVIPFKLDKEQAKDGLKTYLKGKPFLPKIFRDRQHIDEVKGVYLPFWLFDADADADVRYGARRTRAWSDSNYNYVETSHYTLYRAGRLGFDKIPVDGSQKMPDDLMESIEPFDFADAVDFQTAYLSGYFAEKHDVDAEQSVTRANARVRRSVDERLAASTLGYEAVTTESSNVRIRNGEVAYALLPVWLLNTLWKGTRYTFAMNGQTGKFVGDLPISVSALWKWRAILTAAFTVAISALLALFLTMPAGG